jgi:alkylation response protein AidB-like acyl-CoA dehydrogenase
LLKEHTKQLLNTLKKDISSGNQFHLFRQLILCLADMATEIEAAELLINRASELKNNKQKLTKEGAMAKL